MSKTTKIILFLIIGTLILGMALYPSFSKKEKKEKEEKENSAPVPTERSSLNVAIKILQPEKLMDKANLTGSFLPDEEVDLTFEASGKITDIFFKEGSFVKKGTLLAKVNDSPLLAELQKLEAQIPLAEDRVFRQNALLEKDAVSREAYEQVKTELEKLNADIDLVKARIAQTELRAPFDGMIGLRQVSEGNYVTPTGIIATLTKISPLKIEFSVNEKHSNYVNPGTPILFSATDNLNTYKAQVYAVESRIDAKTRTKKARAVYPNTDGKLNPGGTACVELIIHEIENAITVPNEAVIAEMGRDIVYVFSDGKAKLTEVIKGLRTESDIQILSGLQKNDTVIISGIMQLRDGLPVNIVE